MSESEAAAANPPVMAVLADVHVTATDSSWVGSAVTGDARWAVEYVSGYCRSWGIPLVLAGDVFDRASNRAAAVLGLKRSIAKDVEVYGIDGNHDGDTESWLTVAGVTLMDGQPSLVLRSGLKVMGLSYHPPAELAAALETIPFGTDVLVAHQAWDEWSHHGATQGRLVDVPHVRYVISGDNHKPFSETITAADGRPLVIVSPGSACMQSTDEADEHYFVVLHEDGTVDFQTIPGRPIVRTGVLETGEDVLSWEASVDLAGLRAEARMNGVPEEVARPLVIATVRVTAKATWESVRARITAAGAVVRDETLSVEADVSAPSVPDDQIVGPLALLATVLSPVDFPAEYSFAETALRAALVGDDVEAVVMSAIDVLCATLSLSSA